ncbi:MAG TPA: hypothetical protein ENF37_08350 [Beggiatoa sp.]|nr:MAG: hypothetical protein DRR19_27130 [Gammaproteobacteria bacterium]HEW98632.1 hypothetical protein [Beggiatoa sp.]
MKSHSIWLILGLSFGLLESVIANSDDCWATYENGKLYIPCVKIKVPLGEDLKYDVNMEYKPLSNPMIFELIDAQRIVSSSNVPAFEDNFNRGIDGDPIGNGWSLGWDDPPGTGCGSQGQYSARIISHQANLKYAGSQSDMSIYRYFDHSIKSIEFDFIPGLASTNLVSLSAGLDFYDNDGVTLGSIRYTRHNGRQDNPVSNITGSSYLDIEEITFDGTSQHVSFDVYDILTNQLIDINRDDIASRKLLFTLYTGWCGTNASLAIDNVIVE